MKRVLMGLVVLAIAGMGLGYFGYQNVFSPNVRGEQNGKRVIFLPAGCTLEQAVDSLRPHLSDPDSFDWTCGLKGMKHPRPGRYELSAGMSNNALVNMLRAGLQSPVQVTFTPTRHLEDMAGKAARKLQVDSLTLLHAITNPDTARAYGFDRHAFPTMFIPNTYELFWNTDAHGFLQRMASEHKRFWNAERLEQAAALQLTPTEVATIASIVQEEVAHSDEAPKVAAVYLNRIRIGMKLDADPTLKFAWNDWTIRRVLDRHKTIDSPWNTYRYGGIPPGPIALPSTTMLDAVLHAAEHDYLYFVAEIGNTGYHHFSKTYAEHRRYARKYQQSLNARHIYR